MAKTEQATGNQVPESVPQPTARELELMAKLEAKERDLAKAEQQLAESIANETSGLRVRTEERGPYRGDSGGWLFRIEPFDKEKFPHLKPVEIKACDESELIRWYCATHQDPPKSGKQVDPVKVRLKVECLDKGRQDLIWRKQYLSNIRAKLAAGSPLTQKEQSILDANENEVYGAGPLG